MQTKLAAILRHIIDSLFVIVLSAIIVVIVLATARSHYEKFIILATQVHSSILAVVVIAISVVLGWIFPKEMKASVKALKLWPKHWGLAVRGLLGSLLTFGFVWWAGLMEIDNKKFMAFILGVICVEALVLLIGSVVAQIHLGLSESLRRRARDWQTGDDPIHTLEENLFPEYETTSRRILGRLELGKESGGRGPNIAVVGPYGSGKTSLCNLIKDISKKEGNNKNSIQLVFCRFEAWEFLTADAAVRGLLDQIVSKVEEMVDCSGLGYLPEEYLDALRAVPNGWFGMIATMLKKRRNPEEVIRTVQDVLLRLGKRLTVFVDDFDRLESKSKETQQAIAAALNQLQNLTNVQYVLCVGQMQEGAGADLLKLTRFQEIMPEIRVEEVIERIKVLRDEAITGDKDMYYPWNLMKEGSEDPLYYSSMTASLNTNLGPQITKLIRTPRQLKAVERETHEKWNGGLKGEISWYDLLLMSALKVSEPGVFEWIMREPEVFLDQEIHITDPTEEEKEEARSTIEKRLRELLEIKTKARFELIQKVLNEMFPNFMTGLGRIEQWISQREPQIWMQLIALKPGYGSSYFKRYFSGIVPSTEAPDQPTLQYIRDIGKNSFVKKEFEQRYLDSYWELTNDLNRFVQFSSLLSQKLAREVCDCMLDWMCDREHWSIWEQEEEYVSAVMIDVKRIMDNAGQFEFTQARRKARWNHIQETDLEIWSKECIKELVSKDVMVAIGYCRYVAKDKLGEIEAKALLGEVLKEKFIINKESIWEKAKGQRYYLSNILVALKYNDDYENIREQVTQSVVEIAEGDKSWDFAGSIVISLVDYQYPAGRPDLIDEYEFIVNKAENEKTFKMDMLLPVIEEWKERKFEDDVVAKAYEFLIKQYDEELKGIRKLEN